jgi:hypothetical protein
MELNTIFFKDDRMYRHSTMRINYTTYDVRRADDVINLNTSNCNVMLLSADARERPNHQYTYAHVLGIYHVNVIYTGSGALDYRARRMEFLWVRWFVNTKDEPVQRSWKWRQLDFLQFLPVDDENAFGFVDPANVLRGVHVIPCFSQGPRYKDGKGISKCARDGGDWCQYCVGRLVKL